MKVLVTGVNGFSGRYLLEYLKETQRDIHIIGLDINIQNNSGLYKMITCDIKDSDKLSRIFSIMAPDYIVHLAGINYSEHPNELFEVNVLGTISILEAIANNLKKLSPKILIIGSASEYGEVDENELPINEETPLRPISFYGVSKMSQDLLAQQYYLNYKLKIIRARPFNIIGPGQEKTFVSGKIVDEIYKVKKGLQEYINLNDLDSERDFIDIRDVVRAYWDILMKGGEGEVYNVGSGKATNIKDFLQCALKSADVKYTVRVSKSSKKKNKITKSVADISKIKSLIGWTPSISLEKSIQDMINFVS